MTSHLIFVFLYSNFKLRTRVMSLLVESLHTYKLIERGQVENIKLSWDGHER
ncbi:hypothetical protein Syun_010605 [Stephania yunnanensis]|uniref:Uncharacterized protein n=1 Tax=Stephania yunnanensis TaxID=152371 RepID=A0AAP0KGT4_9MAGN